MATSGEEWQLRSGRTSESQCSTLSEPSTVRMTIPGLLSHTQVQTTAHYAHLAADSVKQAVDDVSASIKASLEER